MAERDFDDGNGRPRPPPPAMSEAQRQHLISVGRMQASRYGAVSNYGGLLPPQFGGAVPDNFSTPVGGPHGTSGGTKKIVREIPTYC